MKSWLRHAFAIDKGPAEPTPEQLRVLERLCREVVRRRLTTAAIAFLEMSRPLNYLGSQALHFFAPLISAVTAGDDHQHLATFLERRDAIDRILEGIEVLERSAATPDTAATTPPMPPSEDAKSRRD